MGQPSLLVLSSAGNVSANLLNIYSPSTKAVKSFSCFPSGSYFLRKSAKSAGLFSLKAFTVFLTWSFWMSEHFAQVVAITSGSSSRKKKQINLL